MTVRRSYHPINRNALLLLVLITVVGFALRVYPIGESLWLDELHTSWTVLAPNADGVSTRAQLGNNSPTYFYLVRMVTQSLGNGEWSLRLISLLAGTLLIPGTYFLCRFLRCGIAASLLAAALVAVDRHACFYACEARTYALVQLLALAHLFLFARLLNGTYRLWTWILWTLTGIAMFHLHCTSAMAVVAEAVACGFLVWLRFPIAIQWRYLIIGFAAILIGMASGFELIRVLAERRENWSHFVPATRQPLRILTIFPLRAYLWMPFLSGLFLQWLQRRIGEVGTSHEDAVDGQDQTAWQSHAMSATICLCWLLVPTVGAWVLTETDVARLFFRRYLVASSVALAPLTAMLVSSMAARLTHARWLAVVALITATLSIQPNFSSRVREDWHSAVQAIETHPLHQPYRPVILYSGLIEADAWCDSQDALHRAYSEFPLRAEYPIATERDVILLPRTVRNIADKPPKLQAQTTEAWLLVRGRTAEEIQAAVLSTVGSKWKVAQQSQHGRLTLFLLKHVSDSAD